MSAPDAATRVAVGGLLVLCGAFVSLVGCAVAHFEGSPWLLLVGVVVSMIGLAVVTA